MFYLDIQDKVKLILWIIVFHIYIFKMYVVCLMLWTPMSKLKTYMVDLLTYINYITFWRTFYVMNHAYVLFIYILYKHVILQTQSYSFVVVWCCCCCCCCKCTSIECRPWFDVLFLCLYTNILGYQWSFVLPNLSGTCT